MQNVNYLDVISQATRQMSRGRALLTVGGDSPNTMTIAWGSIGYCWNRPVFTVYVRPCRHTHDILKAQGKFTVSIMLDDADTDIFSFAGRTSGRDTDKFSGHGITAVPGQKVDCPVIGECQLHFECELLQQTAMRPETMRPDVTERQYTREPDFHTIYMGEIVNCYRTDI